MALERVESLHLGKAPSQNYPQPRSPLATKVSLYSQLQYFKEVSDDICMCRVMYGEQARFFDDEIHPTLKHTKKGLIAMAGMCIVCERTEKMRRPASKSARLRQGRETRFL